MNFTFWGTFLSFLLPSSLGWRLGRSLFRPLQLSSFLPFSLVFSTSFIVAKASYAFMYFYAFRSISVIVLGGFFTSETTNSLDFNSALKVVNCTLSSTSSTSKVSRVKRFTYDLRVSFSPCLLVSKWSVGLLGRCPPMKWCKKALPNYSKLSMDNVSNFMNHSRSSFESGGERATQYFVMRLLKAQYRLEGVEVVQGVLKFVKRFKLRQAKFRRYWTF